VSVSSSTPTTPEWEVLSDGSFALDGGAMFGVVPRTLWEKRMPPDAWHRVKLGLNCLLVRSSGRNVLVETGLGEKGDQLFRARHAVEAGALVRQLGERGVRAEDVTDVINSHLHWDHAGGNTRRRGDGGLEPVFPNATYYVQRAELAFARAAGPRTRGSYEPDDYEPLLRDGRMVLVDGEAEIAPGVRVHPAPGHLPAMQVVTVRAANRTLLFAADLIPTALHVSPAWIMAYDLEPLVTLRAKMHWLEQAAAPGWTVVFYHDPGCPAGTVDERDGRWMVHPVGGG
jgi:glyoxylase-like metal-dependent hydrolase (beta-lactamase superfamily II)